jgi:predicted regulator of Ras-like GTPase activity (Roadblock/LC7/MglB family)
VCARSNSNKELSPVFKTALENILERTEGSLGALIMGIDGIAVEQVISPEAHNSNLDVAAAEITSLVRNVKRLGNDVDLGSFRELTLAYKNSTIVARMLSDDYFLLLALEADSNISRGRFELRKAELDLAREFA